MRREKKRENEINVGINLFSMLWLDSLKCEHKPHSSESLTVRPFLFFRRYGEWHNNRSTAQNPQFVSNCNTILRVLTVFTFNDMLWRINGQNYI